MDLHKPALNKRVTTMVHKLKAGKLSYIRFSRIAVLICKLISQSCFSQRRINYAKALEVI